MNVSSPYSGGGFLSDTRLLLSTFEFSVLLRCLLVQYFAKFEVNVYPRVGWNGTLYGGGKGVHCPSPSPLIMGPGCGKEG